MRTLSTPQLLALENQEASVIVGDQAGLSRHDHDQPSHHRERRVSGVRRDFARDADRRLVGRIMLDIHPEVSTGTIVDGVPAQATTEVTTQLLVPSGRTVFIGGLMKHSLSRAQPRNTWAQSACPCCGDSSRMT